MTDRSQRTRSYLGFSFDHPRPDPPRWGWAVLLTLIALALRIYGFTSQAFWTDEVESVKLIFQPGADPVYVLTRNIHGSLHKLLVLGWTAVFGKTDAAARLLSVVIGTLTVPLLYLLARRWCGERIGLGAAFLLAINPFHIWYSQEVRGYVLLMGLGLVAMAALFHEVRVRSRGSAAGLFLASLAASLSSFSGLFIVAAQVLLVLLARWRRDYPIRRFALVQLLVLICLLPYFIELGTIVDPASIVGIGDVAEESRLRGSQTFSPLAPGHSFYAYSVGLTIGPSINEMHHSLSLDTFRPHLAWMGVVVIVFGTLGIVGLVRSRRIPELAGVLVIWLGAPIALTAALALLNFKVYNIRYPAVGFAAWPILLAFGIAAMRGRVLTTIALVAVIGLSATAWIRMHTEERYWRPDARGAAELILREGREGDRILLYTTVEPFAYYYQWRGQGELDVAQLSVWELRKSDRYRAFLDEVTSGEGRLWLVRYRSWYIDPREVTKQKLDAELEHLESWSFVGLPVDLYRCREGTSTAPGSGTPGPETSREDQ